MHRIIHALFAATVIAAAVPHSPVAAQGAPSPTPQTPPPPSFPSSPVGALGRALIDTLNSGDSAAVRAFVERHAAPRMFLGWTPARTARLLALFQAQAGGVTVAQVREVEPGNLRIFTQTHRETRRIGIEVLTDPEGRLHWVKLHRLPDHGAGREPWPSGPLTLAQKSDAIRERARRAAAEDRFSGVVLVASGDSILVHEALGHADRERRLPNAASTRFGTTSVGKMFTGVAIAQLVQAGRLRFEDTLAEVLPEYANVEAARRITMHHLLTHTAGVPELFAAARFDRTRRYDTHLELVATFADLPLDFEPGTQWRYSNGGYTVLGAVIEKVSGMSYEEYVKRHIFAPAGMRHAERPADPRDPGRARNYAHFTEQDPLALGGRTTRGTDDAVAGPLRAFGGGAYAAEDLFRFVRALRRHALLRPDLTTLVTTGKVSLGPGTPVRYAYGFYDGAIDGARLVGHSGSNSDMGWDADVEMLWDEDLTVIALSNYDAPAAMMLARPTLSLLARR